MSDALIIMPKSAAPAAKESGQLAHLEAVLGGAELFLCNGETAMDLKRLLGDRRFATVALAFAGMGHEFPELQAIRSLALESGMVLYLPDLSFARRSRPGAHEKCDLARWHAFGRRIQLNICRQADLVVTADAADAEMLAREVPTVRAVPAHALTPDDVPRARRPHAKTSIIILSFNQLAQTRQCVESVRKHTRGDYELIFVDNGSTDGSREYLEGLRAQDPAVVVIGNSTNRGFSVANNQGIRAASGTYLLLLNNDVIVTDGWLDRMLQCLESDPEIGAVGPCTNKAVGQQVVETDLTEDDAAIQRFACLQTLRHAGNWYKTHRIIGFCFLTRRAVLDTVGLLDERFGPGGYEDYDLCLRVRQAGFSIMVAGDVFIYHIGGHGYAKNHLDYDKLRAQNIEIFIDKWSRKAIEVLELMPNGF